MSYRGVSKTEPRHGPLGAPTHFPLSQPFLLMQNLSLKDTVGSDIMKLEVLCQK